ncbi:MAG: tellurium resistance protein [Rhodobacter sp. CACIA14H1]|nr:MAG: tellurium resistance protein [Rhodobacter sp. CACIA14H1]
MPTAAKLVAAFCFALLAFVTCIAVEGTLPEDTRIGYIYEVSIASGALCGWFISGSARRTGYAEAAATGLRTAVTATVVALGTLALATMIAISMKGRYRGPTDAVLDIFQKFAEFGLLTLSIPALGTLFFGGMLAGIVTENAGRRWR